jgi:hypothetical protein
MPFVCAANIHQTVSGVRRRSKRRASNCDRRSRTADGALVAAIGYDPSAGVLAPRTDEPLQSLQSVEVVQAVLVSCEPRLELIHGSW